MAHDHAHGRGHDHDHGHATVDRRGRAFAVGVALNTLFVVIEASYGFRVGSLALVSDAAHNLGDVLGLLLAWGATILAQRQPTRRHTYGFRGTTILAALANGLLLLAATGGVVTEAVRRIGHAPEVPGGTIAAVAGVGVVVNGVSALLFLADRKRDANVRGAFLHLAADAAVSVAVVIAGGLVALTHATWIDPAASFAVALAILYGTWGLLKDGLNLAIAAVPSHVDAEAVRAHLCALPCVSEVHDLHIWAISTTEVALTVHLAMPWPARPPEFMATLGEELRHRFAIAHVTIQLEPADVGVSCPQAPEHAL